MLATLTHFTSYTVQLRPPVAAPPPRKGLWALRQGIPSPGTGRGSLVNFFLGDRLLKEA